MKTLPTARAEEHRAPPGAAAGDSGGEPGEERGEAERAPEGGERELRICSTPRTGAGELDDEDGGQVDGERRAGGTLPFSCTPVRIGEAREREPDGEGDRPIASWDGLQAVGQRPRRGPRHEDVRGGQPGEHEAGDMPRFAVFVRRRPTRARAPRTTSRRRPRGLSETVIATPTSPAATPRKQRDLATRTRPQTSVPSTRCAPASARATRSPCAVAGIVDQPPAAGRRDHRVGQEQRRRGETQ